MSKRNRENESIIGKIPPEFIIKIDAIREKNGVKTRTSVMREIARGLDPESFVIKPTPRGRPSKKARRKMFFEL